MKLAISKCIQIYTLLPCWSSTDAYCCQVKSEKRSILLTFDLNSTFFNHQMITGLMPRPHPLTRKGVWWPLSDFLVVPSQQNAISDVTCAVQQRRGWDLGTRLQIGWLVEHMVAWRSLISLGCSVSRLLTWHNQKIILNGHQTPFLVRGWGLGTILNDDWSVN